MNKNFSTLALAGGLSWWEHPPVHQKAADSIPGQGTYTGCGFNPPSQGMYGRQLIDVCLSHLSLSLSLSVSLSLSQINKHILDED